MAYSVAIIGATGLVGRTMLQILHARRFPINQLDLYASARSAGTKLQWESGSVRVQELSDDIVEKKYQFVFLSAGSVVSKQYSPILARQGSIVIDNSSAWRADPNVPLVVPEVNACQAYNHHGIIANPNCSTIQLAIALAPINELFGLVRVVVATYQSVSGAGQRGLDQLEAELHNQEPPVRISPHPLAHNAVFHTLYEDGWSEEERKIMTELRRILELPDLHIVATCVRLPFYRSHAEAVWIECRESIDIRKLIEAYTACPWIHLAQSTHEYPTPRTAAGSDYVWIGRVRQDPNNGRALMLWIVADNIRKGAVTNAVQIAELLHMQGIVCQY